MKKSIAIFDIDNTIYGEHSFFAGVAFFVSKGVIPQTVHDGVMNELTKYKKKEQTYQDSANKMLAILASGLAEKNYLEIKQLAREFFEQEKAKFYPYFERILPKLKETHEVWLVTANGQVAAEVIQEMFGLDGVMATVFGVENGLFTGKVTRSLADGKDACVNLVKGRPNSIGVGDSMNDLGIFENVVHPICINPSEDLIKVAQERGWVIVTDKTIEAELMKILA
jgi:HAD superfamily phosphoserine phosphatase-like hydrolase